MKDNYSEHPVAGLSSGYQKTIKALIGERLDMDKVIVSLTHPGDKLTEAEKELKAYRGAICKLAILEEAVTNLRDKLTKAEKKAEEYKKRGLEIAKDLGDQGIETAKWKGISERASARADKAETRIRELEHEKRIHMKTTIKRLLTQVGLNINKVRIEQSHTDESCFVIKYEQDENIEEINAMQNALRPITSHMIKDTVSLDRQEFCIVAFLKESDN